jgi:hypothetical protein
MPILATVLAVISLDSLFAITTFHTEGKPRLQPCQSYFISTWRLKVANMEC